MDELSKKELDLLAGLVFLVKEDMIDLKKIREDLGDMDDFIHELDLSIVDELLPKLERAYKSR